MSLSASVALNGISGAQQLAVTTATPRNLNSVTCTTRCTRRREISRHGEKIQGTKGGASEISLK